VTIVIVGIVFVLGALMMGRAFESYDLTQKTTYTDWVGRMTLERMARELRSIRSSADLTMSGTSTNPIFFNDMAGSAICFCYESATQTVRRGTSAAPNCGTGGVVPTLSCGAGSTRALADNVVANGLNFYYYTATGAAAASAAQVHVIAITLQVSRGGIGEIYRTTVQPRELP